MKKQLLLNRFVIYLIFSLSIFASVCSLCVDIENTITYEGIDLRNRIVGARLLSNGYDPYYFKWNEQLPAELFDRTDNSNSPVSRVTVTPAVLTLFSVISDVPYNYLRVFWLGVQWIALLLGIFIMSLHARTGEQKIAVWILGLLFISSNLLWRFHVERGQVYILYVLFLIVSYHIFSMQKKWSHILAGIILGFIAAMRPTILIMAIPIVAYKKYQLFLGGIIGLGGNVLLTITCYGIMPWQKYFSAMKLHGLIHIQPAVASIQPTIEMVTAQKYFFVFPNIDSSIQGIFLLMGTTLSSNELFLSFLFCCIVAYVYMQKVPSSLISTELFFLISISFVMIFEFFLPAARYPYNDIIWLIPLTLFIIDDNLRSMKIPLLFLLVSMLISFSWIYFWMVYRESYLHSLDTYVSVYGKLLVADITVPFIIVWITSILLRKQKDKISKSDR